MSESTSETGEVIVDSSDRQAAHRKAYGAASKRLREAHRAEFNQFMAEESKALGYEWKPKPTDEEKAAEQLAALLAAHPSLREQVVGTTD
jgi:hypothetical protein